MNNDIDETAGGDWQHQMALDQEYRELDEAVDVVLRGLRQRDFAILADIIGRHLRIAFGLKDK